MSVAKHFFVVLLITLSCAKDRDLSSDVSGTSGSGEYIESTREISLYKPYQQKKRPFLIYYVVDGVKADDEPFMNKAVDWEIKTLDRICVNGARHVNWIVIRNSDVLGKETYDLCWEGKKFYDKSISHVLGELRFRIKDLGSTEEVFTPENCDENFNIGDQVKKYGGEGLVSCTYAGDLLPHLNNYTFDDVKKARKNIGMGEGEVEKVCATKSPTDTIKNLCNTNTFTKDFLELCNRNELIPQFAKVVCEHKIDFKFVYGNQFPTIHPYFIEAVVNNYILHPFDQANYEPVFHFKSHGHIDFALTGLLPHQMFIKKLKQEAHLAQNNIKFESSIDGFAKILDEAFQTNTILKKYIQPSTASKLSLLSQDDPCGLGQSDIGFLGPNDFEGLGASSIYLGNHPGIVPEAFFELLTGGASNFSINEEDIKDFKKSQRSSAFVMLEACDAHIDGDRWTIVNPEIKSSIHGLYSAKGSLGYRNLDWDLIFNRLSNIPSDEQTVVLQQMLWEISKKIKNRVFTKTGNEDYLKVIEELKKIRHADLGGK